MPRLLSTVFVLVLSTGVVACGGGGRDPQPPPPNADGDALSDVQDCAPNDTTRWQSLAFRSIDNDLDGHRVNSGGQLCSGATLPAAHFADAVSPADADCDDADAALFKTLSYLGRDADGDGFAVPQTGQFCTGGALPASYLAAAPLPLAVDCDDGNDAVWRYMTIYSDSDGDHIGAGRGTPTCVGANAPAGFSLYGYDPAPNDGAIADFELDLWQLTPPEDIADTDLPHI
jgi:hypothetical protein